MSYNFKQYDKRWAKKPYCHATMSSDGCGPTAVADIVYNLDKKITPWKVAQWMTKNGYSTYQNGTIHSGITAALKHYGFEALGINNKGSGDLTMKEFLKQMAKGDRWGIILFAGGTKGGITWTLGGHYMAVVDYKVVNGKHCLYMYDSGTRGHNGWYCYETTMKGLCHRAYIAYKKPTSTKKPTETDKKPEPTSKVVFSKEACVKDMRVFAKKYAEDPKYRYKRWNDKNPKSKQCPICHPGSGNGWNCIGFVSAILHHGGGIKDVTCSCSGLGTNDYFTHLLKEAKKDPKIALSTWKLRNGEKWEIVYNNGKKIPMSMLQAGDVLLTYSGDTYKHTAWMYNKSKIADATSGKSQISIRNYSSLKSDCKLAFRPMYTKKVTK